MLSARYGRMKIGRCVKREPGFEPMLQDPRYLGCSADVRDTLSALCSGKSECSLRVNDQTFSNIKPCYDNLKMYLLTAYICVNGTISLPAADDTYKKTHTHRLLLYTKHNCCVSLCNVLDGVNVRRTLNAHILMNSCFKCSTFITSSESLGLHFPHDDNGKVNLYTAFS